MSLDGADIVWGMVWEGMVEGRLVGGVEVVL